MIEGRFFCRKEGDFLEPFQYDLMLWEVIWNFEDCFGKDFLKREDIKEMLKDFDNDRPGFLMLMDSIKATLNESEDYLEVYNGYTGDAKTYFGGL